MLKVLPYMFSDSEALNARIVFGSFNVRNGKQFRKMACSLPHIAFAVQYVYICG